MVCSWSWSDPTIWVYFLFAFVLPNLFSLSPFFSRFSSSVLVPFVISWGVFQHSSFQRSLPRHSRPLDLTLRKSRPPLALVRPLHIFPRRKRAIVWSYPPEIGASVFIFLKHRLEHSHWSSVMNWLERNGYSDISLAQVYIWGLSPPQLSEFFCTNTVICSTELEHFLEYYLYMKLFKDEWIDQLFLYENIEMRHTTRTLSFSALHT